MNWTAKDIPAQAGRRVVITGANTGIGFQIALALARAGAEIVLPARTMEKAADAIARIGAEVPEARLVPHVLDVSSIDDIRAFARFYADRFEGRSLDLLINNAGVMGLAKREVTVDGLERQFATNYLGAFALTAVLFGHLKQQAGTRIVTVGAVISGGTTIPFDDLQGERTYKPIMGSLSQSKLAALLFMTELQRRLSAAGLPMVSVGAHPGVSLTKNAAGRMTGLNKIVAPLMISAIGQSAAQAALPVLFAATSPAVAPVGYYGPNGFKEFKGYPAKAKMPAAAMDEAVARRLWAVTEGLTGVGFEVGQAPGVA